MKKVLFVCLGNICRSAMAEGVFKAEISRQGLYGITSDSAGTSDWHIGSPPDPRAIEASRRRDVDISGQRGRQVSDSDFDEFDFVLAMDGANLTKLQAIAGDGRHAELRLFLDFARDLAIREVEDPYYGGEDGFDRTLDLLEVGVRALADHIVSSDTSSS